MPGYRPKKKSKYLNIEKGENAFRLVSLPIIGWEDWTLDHKPVRFRDNECPKKPIVATKPIKSFWAFWAWDIINEELGVLEIRQASVLNALRDFIDDPKYGDLDEFDIKIFRSGEGKLTQYMVIADKKKPISDEIKAKMKECPVNLEALFDGGNPWADSDGREEEDSQPQSTPVGSPFETLKEHLEIDGIDTSHLQEFLDALSKKSAKKTGKETPIIDVIEAALRPERIAQFKESYLRSLLDSSTSVAV